MQNPSILIVGADIIRPYMIFAINTMNPYVEEGGLLYDRSFIIHRLLAGG
jgi:hypothetical protein